MKPYYLIFAKDNLTLEDGYWTSDLVDLYENEFYKNYSATRSNYGTDLLGNKIWTGFASASPNTDVGVIDGDRIIDYTGRININTFEIKFTDTSLHQDIPGTINVYTTDDEGAYFPDEFASLIGVASNRAINFRNADRYAQFQFSLPTELNIDDIDFQFIVAVSIGSPPVAPLYESTRRLLNRFPEWMDLREDSVAAATPSLDRPETVAGQFINAIAGEWLDHITGQLNVQRLEQYIDTLDADMPSVYHRVSQSEPFISIKGGGVELTRAADLFEFYNSVGVDNVCYVDLADGGIFTFEEFDEVLIDGVEKDLIKEPLWNTFDEFGLMVDLKRIKWESNDRFRDRILDVYVNRPGVGLDAFKKTLRRELDLWRIYDIDIVSDPATPSTEAATPEVLGMADLLLEEDYWHQDGMPTEKFVALAESICRDYPTTWGYFIWDETFWDLALVGNVDNYDVLPHRFDATPAHEIQSGVGDGDDLRITKPTNNVNVDSIELTFTARGIQRQSKEVSPSIKINATIHGQADRLEYDGTEVTHNFVLRIEPEATPGDYIYLNFTMTADNDTDYTSATPSMNSSSTFQFVDEFYGSGVLDATVIFSDDTTMVLTPENMIREPLLSAAWTTGHWNPLTDNVISKPGSNNFKAWHSADLDQTTLTMASGWVPLDLEVDPEDGESYLTGYAVFESTAYNTSVEQWESPASPLNIEINGQYPDETVKNFVMPAPDIAWSPYLEATPNKKYIIQLQDRNNAGHYGVYTTNADDEEVFLLASYLYVNGSNAWTAGRLELNVSGTTTLTFSSGTGASYPITAYENESFTAEFSVDIDDLQTIQEYTSSDFYKQRSDNDTIFLGEFTITKAQLGLSNSINVIITWLGLSANNNGVTVWLDSNIVNPLSTQYPDTEYADNVIVEENDGGTYTLKNIVGFMRVRPGANKFWNPNMHTGWFFLEDEEYYVYHNPATQAISTESATLNDPPQQGAPIIVHHNGNEWRQVAFHDATPSLTIYNTEVKFGNGHSAFYMAYENIYDVEVFNATLNEPVDVEEATVVSNLLILEEPSREGHEYHVTYRVKNSYYVDHDTYDINLNRKPTIVFDHATPNLEVTYETSQYATATPIDVPLHPFYTSTEESFIFISKREYDPFYAEIKLSPQVIVAGDEDYMLVTIKCYDTWGNPKVGYEYDLSTSFGTLRDTTVVTDDDGYAYTLLYSEDSADTSGTIQIDGVAGANELLDAELEFRVHQPLPTDYQLHAMPNHESVPADENNNIVISGIVLDDERNPVPNAIVRYRIGRTVREALMKTASTVVVDENLELKVAYTDWPDTGKTFTDANGVFTIGPFTSQDNNNPGFFFAVLESTKAESNIADANPSRGNDSVPGWPIVGDIVMWHEYPDATLGVEAYSQLPKQSSYLTNEAQATPNFIPSSYPVDYSEDVDAPATPNLYVVNLPRWYPIDKYEQYQLGLLDSATPHPEYKDI